MIQQAAILSLAFAAGVGWWAVVPFIDGRRMGQSDWWRRTTCGWIALTAFCVGGALAWAAESCP